MLLHSLRLVGFKSFRDTHIPFGPFTLLVGTNASGKSNVQDALRFLHGCAQGFSLAEVIDEKWGPGGLLLWRGIRGGVREIVRFGEHRLLITAKLTSRSGQQYGYTIAVAFHLGKIPEVVDESLYTGNQPIFQSERGDLGVSFPAKPDHVIAYPGGRPFLHQVAEDDHIEKRSRGQAREVIEALTSIRFLDLTPDAMRSPATPGQEILGDRGENLSAVLLHIASDKAKKEALLGWLQALTPLDVVDLRFHEDLLGRVLVYLVESNGRETSAQSASDGTLRFLALAAALLSSESGRLFFIEEIDNGLHPTRLHLLLDVIEQATRTLGCQVVATTHNPQLLAFLSEEAQGDAVLLYRREHEDASEAVRVLDLPDVRRVLASQDLGRLFATGWLEDAIEFRAAGVEEAPPKAQVKGRR